MSEWPDDPAIRPTLWRGLHDEYLGSAQAAAQSIAKRFLGQADMAESLCRLVAAPPTIGAIVAAMEALCRGWPQHPKLPQILDHARASANRLIAVTAIRGRIALGVQTPEDFGLLARLAERDDYSVGGFIDQAMLDGWAGDERLRAYALNVTPGERGRRARHLRPDFGLLINGFPGDREVARLVAADFTNQHPHCLFERDDLRALARHFKSDSTIVPALEAWVLKHRSDDGYTLSHVARVAPTPTLKAALLRCVENDRLSFWAAPALVDLWGAADAEVRAALLATAGWPVEKRQHVAHTLPAVVRRLKADDEAYGRMRGILFDQPSPGVKASFPRILAQARTLDADLCNWCRAEYSKEEGVFVAEVGMDLIAGQCRLVRQSVFDLLSGRDV
jgi:hypothetical protein